MKVRALGVLSLFIATAAIAGSKPVELPGLHAAARILRDVDGIPHVLAANEHDMVLLQGWVHARDRLFQMDLTRRQASGTLAELLGAPALDDDVELRTLGLRRAAERSLPLYSAEARAALEAYAEGVNAYVAAHPLPPEYGAIELTSFEPWTALDSLSVGKVLAFGLSFDLDISLTEAFLTYQAAGGFLGFDGAALFFEDLFRSAPFDPASTVPDATGAPLTGAAAAAPGGSASFATMGSAAAALRPEVMQLARAYLERARRVPLLRDALDPRGREKGSNEWAVSGAHTASGRPLVANDPHLALNTPATFYQLHLRAVTAGFDVIGSTFPGAPWVILGQNRRMGWGATVNPMDVTDTFEEQIVVDPGSPSGLSTVYLGSPEHIVALPQLFRYNQFDGVPDNLATAPPGGNVGDTFIPPAVLIVPRRNQGPLIAVDPGAGFGLSVQYTGFSGTRELEAFRTFDLAADLDEFKQGLQLFDVGSQNFAYADVDGNIAYFTSAEMPLREDLQAGFIAGAPPLLIRNGAGGNEWLPVASPQPGQAVPFEILPADEMPQLVNPPAGYFINANNDPAGTTLDNNPFNQLRPGGGIYYLSPGYAQGTRAGRITRALTDRLAAGPVTVADMQAIQADVVLLDAQVFTPSILGAFANATAGGAHPALAALAADPRIAEAVGRLAAWDHSTPTGIPQGYDSADVAGLLSPPSAGEVEASIAATIYSVWRGQAIGNTIDATLARIDAVLGGFGFPPMPRPGSRESVIGLRYLLDNFGASGGLGASGLDFFYIPGVADAATRRDILILKSLGDALDLLAGPAFAAAFDNSTDQGDYRWGRLHRIVLDHPLDGPFDIPPAGGAFPPPLPDLAGIPVDGGFGVVDASSHSARADGSEEFRFGSGPVRRYVGEPQGAPERMRGQTILPGGESSDLTSPFYANLLGRWLTNETYPMRQRLQEINAALAEKTVFVPAK
jgi:penicillin amidase